MSDEIDVRKHKYLPAAERDEKPPVWDMSQERAFIETLLNQRFNFFMVFFSLVIGGAINAKTDLHIALILTLGFVIALLLSLVIGRAQQKLDLIIDDLKTDLSHPIKIIDDLAGPSSTKRRLLGYWIPVLCCIVLFLGAIFAWCAYIKHSCLAV